MDYRDRASVTVHADLESWRDETRPGRIFAFTVDGERLYTQEGFAPGDTFLFGPESVGLPEDVRREPWITRHLRLPMVPGVRSINLSNSVAIVVYEAWRQLGFEGAR